MLTLPEWRTMTCDDLAHTPGRLNPLIPFSQHDLRALAKHVMDRIDAIR